MFIPKLPIIISIAITNRCNLYCKHCALSSGEKLENELTEDEILRIIDYMSSKKIPCLEITGGEPLLHEDIFNFIKYAKSKSLNVNLSTNGTLITSVIAKKIIESELDGLRVSIDGPNKEIHEWLRGSNTFYKMIKGIKNLRKYMKRLYICAEMVIHERNFPFIIETAKLVKNLDIPRLRVLPLSLLGRAKQMNKRKILSPEFWKSLIENKSKIQKESGIEIMIDSPLECIVEPEIDITIPRPCPVGFLALYISANGRIFPCSLLQDLVLGNIRKDDIESVWKNSRVLNEIRNTNLLKKECKSCHYRICCRGGCRGMAYLINRDYLWPDPYCWIANPVKK